MILIFLSSSLINFENLVLQFISRTQERFRNKSNEFFKNKLSIINEKYYHQNNIILFKIFQNYSDINNTLWKRIYFTTINNFIYLFNDKFR